MEASDSFAPVRMPTRTTDLRKRIVLVGAPVVIGVIALGAYLASSGTTREFERASERQLRAIARGAAGVLNQYLRERRADLSILARTPGVIDAASSMNTESRRLGLATVAAPELEQRFTGTGGIAPIRTAIGFLRHVRDSSDLAEIVVVDTNGFTALSTNPSGAFVRSFDTWRTGITEAEFYQEPPALDDSTGTVTLGMAREILDPASGRPVGAVRVVIDLLRLSQLLSAEEYTVASTIEVADSAGRLVLSRDPARRFTRPQDIQSVALTNETNILSTPGQRGVLTASTPANSGRWWIVVRQRQDAAVNAARSIQETVYIASGLALAVAIFLIVWLTEWLHRRVTQPVRMAGAVASRIAGGDLSVSVTQRAGGAQEVRHLLESFATMVGSLRNLVGEIRTAAQESAAMAEEISAATEEMSASTQQMADTCQDLTNQANQQAELSRESADAADRILGISTSLADGAKVAAERSGALVDTASEHRERLLEGGKQLAELASDLEQGAAEARRLTDLSEEIQKFVAQARGIASQTHMLALNAAIEASRATGGEGRGFAVVADEVRKLASQTARSATTTGEVVRNVLSTVQETRERLDRLALASSGVRQIAEAAARALEEMAGATAESSAWSEEIARAANEVNQLVSDINQRLQTIAEGTESIVAASEEIAASAEQQSASTEEIAASASQLADASQHLTSEVSSFRLSGGKGADSSA